jgi:hypothetical protein
LPNWKRCPHPGGIVQDFPTKHREINTLATVSTAFETPDITKDRFHAGGGKFILKEYLFRGHVG